MKDFENELERSFKVLKEGDIIEITVIGISDTEVTADLIVKYSTYNYKPIKHRCKFIK